MVPTPDMPTTTEPRALSAALSQMVALEAPKALTYIMGWHGTPELLQAIAPALPPLSHLCIVLRIDESMTDTVLSIMLQMGEIQAHVGSLALTTTDHGGERWPWAQL